MRFLAGLGKLILTAMLCWQGVAVAAPPSKTALFVENQGSLVTVRWFAENAQGYRFSFAPYPAATPVQTLDMGMRSELTVELPPNSAFYIAAQAYNADGNGDYSDIEYFILDHYALMDKKTVDPAILPLRLDHASLDSPVAFLPTSEDAQVQAEALRTARSATDREARASTVTVPEFEDGKIGLTLHIAPGVVERDVHLAFCLEIDSTCESLLVYDDAAGLFQASTWVYGVPATQAAYVYVDLLLPPALVERLSAYAGVRAFDLRTTDLNSTNPASLAVHTVSVPVARIGGRTARNTPTLGKISFGGRKFGGTSFGAKFDIGMELKTFWFMGYTYNMGGSVAAGQYMKPEKSSSLSNQAGIVIGPELSLGLTVIGKEINAFSAGLKLLKNTGQSLSVRQDLVLFGVDLGAIAVYIDKFMDALNVLKATGVIKQETYDRITRYPFGIYCRVQKADGKSEFVKKDTLDSELRGACSDPPPYVDQPQTQPSSGGDSEAAPDHLLNFPMYVGISYEQYMLLAFVPVRAEFSAGGTVGLSGGGGVDTGEAIVVSLNLGPYAKIGASAMAAVTVIVAEAGITSKLDLLENQLRVGMKIRITKGMQFAGNVRNILLGPNGKIDLYAKWYQPRWGVPPWKENRWDKNLVTWQTFRRDDLLKVWGGYTETCDGEGYQKKCIPTWPQWSQVKQDDTVGETKALGGSDSSATGEMKMPVISKEEPAATETGWACFYEHSQLQGNKFCIKVDNEMKQIGIKNIEDLLPKQGFNDMVSSIKLWPNTAVGVFQHSDYTGTSRYWYSHRGVTIPYVYDDMNDNITSLKLYNLEDHANAGQSSEKKICVYQNTQFRDGERCFTPANAAANIADDPNVFGLAYIGDDWNDKISSLSVVGKGVMLCGYEHSDYNGRENCFFGLPGQGARLENLHDGWAKHIADDISSIRIYWDVWSVTAEHFAGSKGPKDERDNFASSHGSTARQQKITELSDVVLGGEATNLQLVGPLTITYYGNGAKRTYHLEDGTYDNISLGGQLNDRLYRYYVPGRAFDLEGHR